MKQILQSLKNGETTLAEVPIPTISDGECLVKTRTTLISSGTERMLVSFGKSNYLEKVKSQPEKVSKVIDKIKTDGVLETYDAVSAKLDQPVPLGYSNVGVVIASKIDGIKEGDRIVSNSPHAEYVVTKKNLCSKIPNNVSDQEASFTIVGSIALQGIRLAQPQIGETVVVYGLGLVGLMCVQLLVANGCRVIGVDIDESRLRICETYGAQTVIASDDAQLVNRIRSLTDGVGCDAVIITASSNSDQIITNSAQMSRKRGQIVLVGVIGLKLNRDDFYEKELDFKVSCSYGPGRYDPLYEDHGIDYPIEFARWTLKRNFGAVLHLFSDQKLNIRDLVTHTYSIDNSLSAIDTLLHDKQALGIGLQFSDFEGEINEHHEVTLSNSGAKKHSENTDSLFLDVLGAGNYSSKVLIPAFKKCNVTLNRLVSVGGTNAYHQGKKHKFLTAATLDDLSFRDSKSDLVAIVTRHNLHASQVCDALKAGKHVFCEKPLCLNLEELDQIQNIKSSRNHLKLMIGFNRRFSVFSKKIKSQLNNRTSPIFVQMDINAGYIEDNHWTQNEDVGGGRLIGEGCHFVDYAKFLVASTVENFTIKPVYIVKNKYKFSDSFTLQIDFEDGSRADINYVTSGNRQYPKELITVYHDSEMYELINFKRLNIYKGSRKSVLKRWRQDKGQTECCKSFINSIENGLDQPIPLDDIYETSRIVIEANDALKNV